MHFRMAADTVFSFVLWSFCHFSSRIKTKPHRKRYSHIYFIMQQIVLQAIFRPLLSPKSHIRIPLRHPFIREMLINHFHNRILCICCCRIAVSGCVSNHHRRGYHCIHHHKGRQQPGADMTSLLRNPVNQIRQPRIDSFDPYHAGNAPEKAEQQVDSSTQVKWQTAVIPEYSSEYHFGKYAAYIFVGSSQNRSPQEHIPVAFLPELIEKDRCQHTGQPPYYTKLSVHYAASSYQFSRSGQHEDSFHNVSKKRRN